MKTYLGCIPCFMKQALVAARIASPDESMHKKIIDEVAGLIPGIRMDDCPPEMGRKIHDAVKKISGNTDPYKGLKEKYNKLALDMYPGLKEKAGKSGDPLFMAIRIAIAGNVIDFGAQLKFELDKDVKDAIEKEMSANDYDVFRQKLKEHKEILYLGDNAGETVFDRVLIEELAVNHGKKIIYAVKEKPVINDAVYEDAVFAGIDKYAKVISSGSDAPGTVRERCSRDFLQVFDRAGFIISKGQGNYEALSGGKLPVFYLFKVKCTVLSKSLDVPIGSVILKYGG